MDQQNIIGNEVNVSFISLGNRKLVGKVDTGATTSSLHATNIQTSGNRVSFVCPDISSNSITMELSGAQEVHSADGGGQSRPIVKFDIEINGRAMQGVSFNLNDRSNMDDPVLVGQNVLQAGNFIIDVKKDVAGDSTPPVAESIDVPTDDVAQAVDVLIANNITIEQLAAIVMERVAMKAPNDE